MTLRVCPTPDCGSLTHGGPCPDCRAEQRKQRGSQGYGRPSRRRKAELLPAAIGNPCVMGCGRTITMANADLDHAQPKALGNTDVGDRIVCSTCNRAAGGRLSAALRLERDA